MISTFVGFTVRVVEDGHAVGGHLVAADRPIFDNKSNVVYMTAELYKLLKNWNQKNSPKLAIS